MELLVLGPVEAVVDGRSLQLGARKQRAVLAMLVLEANRPVSADRLIEGLWGESPPDSAPKMVQLYISQLRKALQGQDVTITTRGRGYELSCAPESVDLVRAERLITAATAAGEANGHAREALALWRGATLADVADEPFAAAEIRRCDELWLQAKELAIDADLAAGRTEDALREALALAEAHPLREHVQAQVILALYRAGRQADALEAFRAARARLVEEIGSEPGPELRRLHDAILHQSPELDAPRRVRGAAARAPLRSRGRRVAVFGAILASAAVGVALVSLLGKDDADAAIDEDSVAILDPASGRLKPGYPVGRGPSAVATGAGSLWVANGQDGTVSRIDRARNVIVPIDIRARPVGLAFGADSLWVAADDRTIVQIDPATNTAEPRIPLRGLPSAVAITGDALWVAEPRNGIVERIDVAQRVPPEPLPAGESPSALAVGADAVWVTDEGSGRLIRLDPRKGTEVERINVGNGPADVAVGAGAVWVANRTDGTVSRIDPRTDQVTKTIPVDADAAAVAVAGGAVWVADAAGGSIARLDPATGQVTKTSVGSSPSALEVADGALWIATGAVPASHRGGHLVVESSGCSGDCMDPSAGFMQAWETLTLVYDGLLGYPRLPGAAGEKLVGALATSVPEPTDGGRTYVFRLRPGIRYSTGEPVRAADVRASIQRAVWLSRNTLPRWFANIVGAEDCTTCDLSQGILTDERARTVTFRLSEPEPEFPYKLASPTAAIVPASTPLPGPGSPPPLGTGPYMFEKLDMRGGTRLVRNPHFRSWSAVGRPDGFVDTIEVRRHDDAATGVNAVKQESSDIAEIDYSGPDLSAREREGLVTRYPSRIASAPFLGTGFMFLNVREPPFDDVRVRQAINFATDRKRVVKLSGGFEAAHAACTAVPVNVPHTRPYCAYTARPSGAGTWNAPDLEKARRLIAASGTRGMTVRVWTNDTNQPLGRYFVRLLKRLGYRSSILVKQGGASYWNAAGRPESHAQIGWDGYTADYPLPASFFKPSFSCDWVGRRSLNLSQFCSRSLDDKVEAALAAEGPAAEDAWAAATRELDAQAPYVPLTTSQRSYFTSPRLGNVQQHPLLGVMLEYAWVH